MTANEATPDYRENVTDGQDYERYGREMAARELERYAMRLRHGLLDAAETVREDGENLAVDDMERIHADLAAAQVALARIDAGECLPAHEVLGND
mgnify:CR=1 FL=1